MNHRSNLEYERFAKSRWRVYQDIFPGDKTLFLLREKLRDPKYAANFLQNTVNIHIKISGIFRHVVFTGGTFLKFLRFPVIGGNETIYMTSGTTFSYEENQTGKGDRLRIRLLPEQLVRTSTPSANRIISARSLVQNVSQRSLFCYLQRLLKNK